MDNELAAPRETQEEAKRAVERTARESYGRLLAFLVARTGDVAGAEDALGDAFLKALETWPQNGVPDRPEAWILTAARRRQVDAFRHAAAAAGATMALIEEADRVLSSAMEPLAGPYFADQRLKLLFLCTDPAIDPAVRTPLMLQTALGIDAETIANAFLIAPATMGQRLTRAKARIRQRKIQIDAPAEAELPDRINDVLQAIYAAFGLGWDRSVYGADCRWRGLRDEAIWLGRLTVSLLPHDPAAKGLLALMLYCESRVQGRRSNGGEYVPLSEQDASLWSIPMIVEAEGLLKSAFRPGRFGRFQIEAAIQSAHSRRAFGEPVDWCAVAELYAALVRLSPSVGALVGRAAAVAESSSPADGLRLLQQIDATATAAYQPYWALRAHLLSDLGFDDDANTAYQRAIGLSEDPAVRDFLRNRAPRDCRVDATSHIYS